MMSHMPRPEVKIRFSSKGQKDRVVKAAKLKRWSLTTFITEAADKMASEILDHKSLLEALNSMPLAKGEEGPSA